MSHPNMERQRAMAMIHFDLSPDEWADAMRRLDAMTEDEVEAYVKRASARNDARLGPDGIDKNGPYTSWTRWPKD